MLFALGVLTIVRLLVFCALLRATSKVALQNCKHISSMLFALGMLTIVRLLVFCARLRATNASNSCDSKAVSTSVPSGFHALIAVQ